MYEYEYIHTPLIENCAWIGLEFQVPIGLRARILHAGRTTCEGRKPKSGAESGGEVGAVSSG